MKKNLVVIFICLFFINCLTYAKAYIINVEGPIGPASSAFISQAIESSQTDGKLIIITIDTPGGLSTSTREIVKAMLNSKVPTLVFVTPKGARAASAGTYILYGATIAVMSPGTHLGAASPVSIINSPTSDKSNSTIKNKVKNDAKAYMRTLAQLNNRNIDFAVKSVSHAKTLTSKEALKKKVINLIALDVSDLLTKLNNYSFKHHDKIITLKTKNWQIIKIKPSWRTRILSIISSPTIAYLLLLLGVYGLFFELSNPGAIIPGVIGAIALFVALYALQMLPINYAGLGLILLGLAFMTGEAFIPSFGILGIGGITAFVFGSLLLMDPASAHFQIAKSAIAFMAFFNVLFLFLILKMVLVSHKLQVENSLNHLIGRDCHVVNTKSLQVKIDGEIWSIICDKPLKKDMTVEVFAVEGIHLMVKIKS